MKSSDRTFIQNLVADEAGIELGDEKQYLMESRLKRLAREEGFENMDKLIDIIRKNPDGELLGRMVAALTTNESYFFRDQHPFDTLRDNILPELLENRTPGKNLRLWSAACSRGQEPYSIAMLMKEHFPRKANRIDIYASDISGEMVRYARRGEYTPAQVARGLPDLYQEKYFRETTNETWEINDSIKKMVKFRQLNLTESFSLLPQMDAVFLRYVLTYFDAETKSGVLERTERRLADDGYLILGGTEMVMNLDIPFEREHIGSSKVYRPAKADSSNRTTRRKR